MKLLIITQSLNTEHPILGFFHRWVKEFAKNCEKVTVIALEVGKHDLPSNVSVYSLGKSEGKGKLVCMINFYKLIWQLRKEYDQVFVHMNQIYVILGWLLWRALGNKIGLWYTHGSVPLSLKIAEKLTDKIFTASADSFNIKSHKVMVTGHGIDTDLFKPTVSEKIHDLVTVGRITASKDLKNLVDVLSMVRKTYDVSLTVVGVSVTEEEKEYEKELHSYISEKDLTNYVRFVGKANQSDLPTILNKAKVFVTASQTGSLDKAVLEAMSCGLPVVSMATGTNSLPLGKNQVISKEELSQKTMSVLESNIFMFKENHDYIEDNHSLQSLIKKITNVC